MTDGKLTAEEMQAYRDYWSDDQRVVREAEYEQVYEAQQVAESDCQEPVRSACEDDADIQRMDTDKG